MYYEERGTGDPLWLIMGITARGTVWEKHAEYWARDFRCILPDNRGVRLSDKFGQRVLRPENIPGRSA
jgi:pimeloyl-ACP methyl ester carboxylesterase